MISESSSANRSLYGLAVKTLPWPSWYLTITATAVAILLEWYMLRSGLPGFWILAAPLGSSFLVVLLAALVRRFASSAHLPLTPDWIYELSIDRYRPMLRLLSPEELEILRAQPGFTPQAEARFRSARCRLLRKYLQHLNEDFKRICMALKVLMVKSTRDRPDLAWALLGNQLTFAYGMTTVRIGLLFYRFGVGTVDVAGLVRLFDGLRIELRTVVQADLAARA
ncbi:MAG TPA: hypothetical protein VMH81_38880 [Bryobacteraceae bacterium]|nr:hypothetical protein [Bryobacteraceae bacterium]